MERHVQPFAQHAVDRVVGEVGDHAQLEVGQRADRQRHAAAREPRGERGVLQRAVAVVDPVDAKQVERLGDIGRRSFLARVRAQQEPPPPRLGEHARELGRRVADLR